MNARRSLKRTRAMGPSGLGGTVATHVFLIAYTLLAVGPIVLIVMNSFKSRSAIFGAPFAPPSPDTFSLIGYQTVLSTSKTA
jgi:raffinose/stachyose/melibiose transport system permease protein